MHLRCFVILSYLFINLQAYFKVKGKVGIFPIKEHSALELVPADGYIFC